MPLVECPKCQSRYRINEDLLAREVKCPKCKIPFQAHAFEVAEADAPSPASPPPLPKRTKKYCFKCGESIPKYAETCPECGISQPGNGDWEALTNDKDDGTGMIAAGYICAGLSILFCPAGLSVAGLVIGIINLTKNRTAHGIAQIILSVFCGALGFELGLRAQGQ